MQNDNNFGYENITILVYNMPLTSTFTNYLMNIAKSTVTDQFVFMIKSYEYLGPWGNISIVLYSTRGRQ